MPLKCLISVATIATVGIVFHTAPAGADGNPRFEPGIAAPPGPYVPALRARHRGYRAEPMLPPEIRYRDPRAARLAPPRGPDFPIHAYLPRFTEVPMYNEPPQRFPQR